MQVLDNVFRTQQILIKSEGSVKNTTGSAAWIVTTEECLKSIIIYMGWALYLVQNVTHIKLTQTWHYYKKLWDVQNAH
jgi:hypothetical protein